jgi:hypothetical protein
MLGRLHIVKTKLQLTVSDTPMAWLYVLFLCPFIGLLFAGIGFSGGSLIAKTDKEEIKFYAAIGIGFIIVCFFAWLFWGHWGWTLGIGIGVILIIFGLAIYFLLGKNKAFRLREGFWATVLVSVVALGVAVGLSYMAGSVLIDVAKHPSKPAAPNLGFDRFEEYAAAKRFIQAQYPGAQSFSDCDDSTVVASYAGDGYCSVTFAVSGVNGFNAPIRDTMTVKMIFQNGTFQLQRIESQNEQNLARDLINSE